MRIGLKSFRGCVARAIVGCFVALALSGAAFAQGVLSCPVTTNTTLSTYPYNGDTTNPSSTPNICIVQSSATLTIAASTGGIFNVDEYVIGLGGVILNYGKIVNDGVITNGDDEGPTSGTITNFGTLINNNILDNTYGVLTNAGILTNFGALQSGTVYNTATLTNENILDAYILTNIAGATLNNTGVFIGSGSTITNNGTFTNYEGGQVDNESGVFLNGGTFINDGTWVNTINASFEEPGGSILTNNGTFTNNGMFTNASNGYPTVNTVVNNGIFDNNGTFTNAGILDITYGGVLSNAAGSTFVQTGGQTVVDGTLNSVPAVQIQGGVLSGTGTVNGNVNNSGGLVQPGDAPGTLTIKGNYTQGAFGTLWIELGGTAPGDFSVLDVSGVASLNGAVDFAAVNGFTPGTGDDFAFLNFGSLSGDFFPPLFTNWSCPAGDTCDLVYGANSVSLDILAASGTGTTTTPEPSSVLLLGIGMLALGIFQYRRLDVDGLR
ncbi:MAG: PEP-CTERM sorting domain-containing protein [Candidatus Acidiferrales bacterium]